MTAIIVSLIYLTGCVAAFKLLRRFEKNYAYKHPDETKDPREAGYFAIGVMLSWLSVIMLIFGSMASFNQLDWEEYADNTPVEITYPEQTPCAPDEEALNLEEELERSRKIARMREMELQAAQKEAMNH